MIVHKKIVDYLHQVIVIPPDKSISHRALIISSMANGVSKIYGLLDSEDILSTTQLLRRLGIKITFNQKDCIVYGKSGRFEPTNEPLMCGNSGTTIRLMFGLLALSPHRYIFTGDSSLSKRPMNRVTLLLESIGIEYPDGTNFLPIVQCGISEITKFDLTIPLPSAQVKSSLLLAAVQGNGGVVRGRANSRNHTELMLQARGIDCTIYPNGDVEVVSGVIESMDIQIPSDFSSASFFIIAGLLLPNCKLTLNNVGLNPSRTGLLSVLLEMGARINITNERIEGGEKIGDLNIQSSALTGIVVHPDLIPTMIDEIPILAIAASQATGMTVVTDAEDLRKKESDRISSTCNLLMKFGVDIDENKDGWSIEGPQQIHGASIRSNLDHRIAMSAAIAGLISKTPITIIDPDSVNTSFPTFWSELDKIAQLITIDIDK